MLKRVTATRFDRRLSSGRTKPCIVYCEAEDGESVEIVLKLAATCEIRGLICEAMASMLADDLDLPTPEPFQIEVESAFAGTIPDEEIRQLAYRFWQEDGCHDGYDVQHWLKAETIWWEEHRRQSEPNHPKPVRSKRKKGQRSSQIESAGTPQSAKIEPKERLRTTVSTHR